MKPLLILMMMAFIIPIAIAQTLQLDYDNYFKFNTTETIGALYRNASNELQVGCVQITFESKTYNMSNTSTTYYVNVIENVTVPYNVPFLVVAYNDTSCENQTHNLTGEMKWRIPFDYTFRFYRYNDNNTDILTHYKNEFDIVYLQFYNPRRVRQLQSLHYLDNMFGWVPFYEKGQITQTIDVTESFWTYYEDGEATITLYEPGNYSLYILSLKRSQLEWPYEFIKPQPRDRVEYDSKVLDMFEINNQTAKTYNIKMSVWEMSWKWVLGNLATAFFWLILWLVVVFFVTKVNPKAGGAVAIATLPFLMKLLGVY